MGGHKEHGEHKESSPGEMPRMDNFFGKIGDYITSGISTFVAAIFIIITIGAFYGFFVARHQADAAVYFLIAPAIVGLIAYYNRAFAVAIFIVLVLIALI